MKKLFVLLFSSIFVLSSGMISQWNTEAKDTKPPKTLTVKRVTTETIFVKGKTEGGATVEVRGWKEIIRKSNTH